MKGKLSWNSQLNRQSTRLWCVNKLVQVKKGTDLFSVHKLLLLFCISVVASCLSLGWILNLSSPHASTPSISRRIAGFCLPESKTFPVGTTTNNHDISKNEIPAYATLELLCIIEEVTSVRIKECLPRLVMYNSSINPCSNISKDYKLVEYNTSKFIKCYQCFSFFVQLCNV